MNIKAIPSPCFRTKHYYAIFTCFKNGKIPLGYHHFIRKKERAYDKDP